MIKSMTGFGRAKCVIANKSVSIELKSLNSKQLDIHSKLPNIYREKDLELRNELSNRIIRGKLELTITVEYTGKDIASLINTDVIKKYYRQLQSISKDLEISNSEPLMQVIMRLPDVLKTDTEELKAEEWKIIRDSFIKAIDELNSFREKEGAVLGKDLIKRITLIEAYLKQIENFEPQRVENIKKRINSNLNEFIDKKNIDHTRLEQELIYYLEKLDITEEKIRLKNHCHYFVQVLNENKGNTVGKKLGFIAQEAGREINTLGSKANDFEIQKLVVMMKDELEKIKEQLMNIL